MANYDSNNNYGNLNTMIQNLTVRAEFEIKK